MAESRPSPKSIFVSYARRDGGTLALRLQADLIAAGFDVWLDTSEIEGGASWSVAIEKALDQSEIALVILSHAAHVSEICRAEQIMSLDKGKRVIPVLAQSDAPRPVHLYTRQYLDFSSTSHYQPMLKQLVELLQTDESASIAARPVLLRPRLNTAPKLPPEFVSREAEMDRLRHAILDDATDRTTIQTVLSGPGGVGKSMIAMALCHDEMVQAAFPDGVLWLPIGRKPGELIEQIKDLGTQLGDSADHYTTEADSIVSLHELLKNKSVLIILDDVVEAAHAEPFRMDAPSCRVLITSRNKALAPALTANELVLGTLTSTEAIALLDGLTKQADPLFETIAEKLSNLPLALKLAGARLKDGLTASEWLDSFKDLPEAKADQPLTPDEARDLCFDLSVEQIPAEDRQLYHALGIFQGDRSIPQGVIVRLWRAIEPNLSELGCLELIAELSKLALIDRDNEAKTIALHNLLRDYTRAKLGDQLTPTHQLLLNAYNPAHADWYTIPDDGYLYDALLYHLDSTGHRTEYIAALQDLRYIAARTFASKATVTERDLKTVAALAPEIPLLQKLYAIFPTLIALLERCTTLAETSSTLYNHLMDVPELAEASKTLEAAIPKPNLIAWHPLPELISSKTERPAIGHTGSVFGCAVSPDGTWAVSASEDMTLKVWETSTGQERFRLTGHTSRVTTCAISADGRWIISGSDDKALKIWDAITGSERITLTGHNGAVNSCAPFPDRYWIMSTSDDGTVKLWDTMAQSVQSTLIGHDDLMNGCAVSPMGDWIVAGSKDKTLKVWDVVTALERLKLTGHGAVINACAITPNGDRIVSASADHTLKVWDSVTGEEQKTLTGHSGEVYSCEISPNGEWIASTAKDQTLKVWNIATGECLATFYTDGILYGCAWSSDNAHVMACGEGGIYWLRWNNSSQP